MRNLHDPRIDWSRHAGLYYVVVDPQGAVLYFDELRYLRETRVWNSNELSFKLLAVPTDIQPTNDKGSVGETVSPAPGSPSGPTSSSDTGTKKDQNSPPIPRWKNWASKTVSSFLKWRNSPAGGYNTSGASAIPRKGGRTKLKFVGSLVLPSKGNLTVLLNDWQNLLSNLVDKPSFDARKHSHGVSNHILSIFIKNGGLYMVKYLKVSYIIVLKYLAGQVVHDTRDIGPCVKLRKGLPAWFPLVWRNWIRRRDLSGIRFVLSWLYIYKAMEVPNIVDLSTIESAPWLGDSSDFRFFVYKAFKALKIPTHTLKDLAPTGYTSLMAGPNNKVISAGIRQDVLAWLHPRHDGGPILHEWMGLIQTSLSASGIHNNHYIQYYNEIVRQIKSDIPLADRVDKLYPDGVSSDRPSLGKLSTFSDGGGKQRIVALPDYWTQMMLKPLHNILMNILKLFPQDATYDQDGKLREFVDRGYKAIWSLDLKSATDLIPQRLYQDVLSYIFGQYIAELWIKLLTRRDYRLRRKGHDDTFVRYTRGQPMGALSSWPAMALVHHMVVLYAAFLSGLSLEFKDYLVLGDDVVIANKDVAEKYVEVCDSLGISVSLSKSFVSTSSGLLQFASQVYLNGKNVSPVSFKQEVVCRRPIDRLAQAWSILNRWYPGEGIPRLIRLMVPRSLWPDISRSLSSGESHPLIQLITRTVLIPGTQSSTVLGSTRATIKGYLSTFSGSFNLGRILALSSGTTCDRLVDLSPLEVSLLRQIIDKVGGSVFETIEDFKKALNMVDETDHSNHTVFDFYFCSFNILMERQIFLLDKFFPHISRIMYRSLRAPSHELPDLLISLLDVIPKGQILSNFTDDLIKPSQIDLNKARLISKYNLESSLVPKSLWRTITNFGLTVERISRASEARVRKTGNRRKK